MLKKLLMVSAWAFPCSIAAATPLQASFDPDAQYVIVKVSGNPGRLSVITQRTGLSGTSFSARQFDCISRTVRFMGSSTSLKGLADARPDDEPTPIFKGSLSRAISEAACDVDAPKTQDRATLSVNTQ
ncbi:hypothetical protein V0R59_01440 [Pseudomonas sp. 147P]|nr:hypothetical protein [Pseudomonas sp. 147P]